MTLRRHKLDITQTQTLYYAASLSSYVSNNTILDQVILTPGDVQTIITNEIVPCFNVNAVMFEVDGLVIKNDSFMTLVSQAHTSPSATDCMVECQMNDKCVVSTFNVPSKQCTMMSSVLPDGVVVSPSIDDVFYSKNDPGTNLLVEGGNLVSQVQGLYTNQLTDGTCGSSCLAGSNCVFYQDMSPTGTCSITTADSNIDVGNISKCSGQSNCIYYKQNVVDVGQQYDLPKSIVAAKETIVADIVKVVQKYKYEFSIVDNNAAITQSLQTLYGTSGYNSVSDVVTNILDEAQAKANATMKSVKNTPPPKYITQDEFVQNMNNMTYQDFGNLYYTVDTLTTVIGTLNTLVQSNVSANLSAENNPFLAQERTLDQYKWVITNVSLLMVLGFLCVMFGMYKGADKGSSSTEPQKVAEGGATVFTKFAASFQRNTSPVENMFRIVVPAVLIAFVIVIMASVYQKKYALYMYNREVLEKNGGNLVVAITDARSNIQSIHDSIANSSKGYSLDTKLQDMQLSTDTFKQTYKNLTNVSDLLDKCNLLMDGAEVILPFPWADVTVNIITIFVSVAVTAFVFVKIGPFGKLGEIRDLNKYLGKLMKGVPITIELAAYDETDDMDDVLKVIALIVFVMMIAMFSQKLMKSSKDYQMGLYNSRYYSESRCAE